MRVRFTDIVSSAIEGTQTVQRVAASRIGVSIDSAPESITIDDAPEGVATFNRRLIVRTASGSISMVTYRPVMNATGEHPFALYIIVENK